MKINQEKQSGQNSVLYEDLRMIIVRLGCGGACFREVLAGIGGIGKGN